MTTITKRRQMSFGPIITIAILAATLGALASEAAPNEQQQQLQLTTTTTTSQTTSQASRGEWRPSERTDNSTKSWPETPRCQLGNDTYHLGERWSPNLPPFGVQVCVLCECIARERKSCYEAKVICRRITNECPKLDSCPDGKKPVTTPGQCCKSCQNEASRPQVLVEAPTQAPALVMHTTGDKLIIFKNDRIKDSLDASSLPACPISKPDLADTRTSPSSVPTTSTKYKGQVRNGAKNELNGIDSRKLFKWLDNEHSIVTSSNGGKMTNGGGRTSQPTLNTGDESNQQQHPNDVQSGLVNFNHVNYHEPATTSRPPTTTTTTRPYNSSNTCALGNDTFLVGERWNPVLPPMGVQVCVLCNCIVRVVRRVCYEPKVVCKRISNDCPIIRSCPNGKKPMAVVGQCCKSCQSTSNNDGEHQDQGEPNVSTNSLTLTTTTATTIAEIVTTTVVPAQTHNPELPLKSNPNPQANSDRATSESIIRILSQYPSCSALKNQQQREQAGGGGTRTAATNSSAAAATVPFKRSIRRS